VSEEQDDTALVYLELDDILEFYAAVIGGSVEQARDQLRDPAGLEGALARPAVRPVSPESRSGAAHGFQPLQTRLHISCRSRKRP